MSCNIMLVDDHPLFRMGLRLLLEREETFSVVAECDNPDTAWAIFQKSDIHLIICDLSFPNSSGLNLVKNIRDKQLDCPILILSMHNEGFWAERVLQEGVNGYLMKDENIGQVIEATYSILKGNIYISPVIQQKILKKLSNPCTGDFSLRSLSTREKDIFRCMSKDMSTTEIASALFISIKTVQTHQSNIKKKLDMQSLSALRDLAHKYVNTKF